MGESVTATEASRRFSNMLDRVVAISAITASELLHGVHGVYRANTAQRRHRRQVRVEAVLASLTIAPFDLGVARVHARIWADLMASGTPIGAHDFIIGATARPRHDGGDAQ